MFFLSTKVRKGVIISLAPKAFCLNYMNTIYKALFLALWGLKIFKNLITVFLYFFLGGESEEILKYIPKSIEENHKKTEFRTLQKSGHFYWNSSIL